MTHLIEVAQGDFKAINGGYKTFIVVKTDRKYSVDDTLIIQGYENGESTSKLAELNYKIDYIDENSPALKKGYCIVGIKEKES